MALPKSLSKVSNMVLAGSISAQIEKDFIPGEAPGSVARLDRVNIRS